MESQQFSEEISENKPEHEKNADREVAIEVKDVVKVYKLYDRMRDRIKDAFGLGKNTAKLHYALNHVNMKIYRGETVGIIGTNGSGKSTILKIITGVLHQTEGEINVNGRISALLELGAGFNPEYSGLENVYLNGTMIGFSEKEIEEKLPAILEFADIGDYIYQPVKTYSSGMFVRLAFAVAINIEPEILIVDEALSVGDVFFQAKCYHKFEEFRQMGKTIVFVSHDLSSISKYCDRVFLLNQGVILGEGSAKEMINAYKRVLVGQYEGDAATQNPDIEDYGNQQAKITQYSLLDEKGLPTTAILKGSEYTFRMRVEFKEHIPAPIFCFSLKNVQGVEITGTNTMIEKAYLESGEPGMVKDITFSQKMTLQGGEYLVSLGVTGYRGDTFEVYHRLYDVVNITVVSDKDTVGYYDMESRVKVTDVTDAAQ